MTAALAKWTLDDYHRMTTAGILDRHSVELLNGEAANIPEYWVVNLKE